MRDRKSEGAELLWTRAEVADFLGIAPHTLDQWAWRRCGPRFRKIGGRVRYDPSDVRAWLDRCETGGAA